MQALQDGTALADMTASYHTAGILRLSVATTACKTFCFFFFKASLLANAHPGMQHIAEVVKAWEEHWWGGDKLYM